MKKKAIFLMGTAIVSAAILAGCNTYKVDNPEYTTAENGDTIITEETAKRAAAGRAKLNVEDVQYTKIEYQKDDGRFEYDIEFVYDGYEYEVEVNAEDGTVTSYDRDKSEKANTVSESSTVEVPAANTENSGTVFIGEDEALNAALAKSELSEVGKDSLSRLRIKLDKDNGRNEYDIEFVYDGYEYDFEIDAADGRIDSYEREKEDGKKPTEGGTKETSEDISNVGSGTDVKTITEDEALKIALGHAGVNESDVTVFHVEPENDDGRFEYEVEFVCGYSEYDYDIDAESGEILNFDRDAEHCEAPEVSAPQESEMISYDEAKSAAYSHAGIDEANVYDLDIELDRDNGVYKYELEFKCDGHEYEYEINALDGSVIRYEKDRD